MGKNSRQRREARRRAHQRTTRVTPRFSAGDSGDELDQTEIIALIEVATQYAVAAPRAVGPRIARLNEIGAVATTPHLDPAALVVDEVLSRIRAAWECGWQPLDLVHAARRRTTARSAAWIARAVLIEADRTRARELAPQDWGEQLGALAERHDRVGPDALLAPCGGGTVAEWTVALVVLDFLHRLPPSQLLRPPPSQWGRRTRPTSVPAPVPGEPRYKTLTKVRALLAKAESTEFAAEAEALTAKAQDLMTRHSIDEALLVAEAGESIDVQGLRLLIHQPYAVEKTSLLHVIARANRAHAVWNEFASFATLVGVPTDLAQVEMLFTSTLVQATRAMTQAGQGSEADAADRSSSFRKAFLIAYAQRIGERLERSSEEAAVSYGTGLVPVLQRQAEAIENEFERLFPNVTTGSRRTRLDARGWAAGTRAADAAVLPAAEVQP